MSKPGWVGRRLPSATNYRGKRVVAWLGIALAAALIAGAGVCAVSGLIADGHVGSFEHRLLWMASGIALVFVAGLNDDYRQARTRGFARQLRLLLRGEVTSGIVKLVVIVLASALVAWMLGARGLRFGLGVPVIAASANLWNLLDVVPGRALKYFVPAAVALAIIDGHGEFVLLAAIALLAASIMLVVDLREEAMLGDSGSNVLGFVVGIGLLRVLSMTSLSVALALLVALHVIAETFTLSKAIAETPPLRWFDQLGRVRSDGAGGDAG